jgi:hypothetical protein
MKQFPVELCICVRNFMARFNIGQPLTRSMISHRRRPHPRKYEHLAPALAFLLVDADGRPFTQILRTAAHHRADKAKAALIYRCNVYARGRVMESAPRNPNHKH